MTPEQHALLSVKRYGGEQSDYYNVHYLMDFSKHFMPNGHFSHRAFSHNWWGITLIEQLSSVKLINGISVRQILIDHVREDCGVVPTMEECMLRVIDGTYYEKYNKPCKKSIEYLKSLS